MFDDYIDFVFIIIIFVRDGIKKINCSRW